MPSQKEVAAWNKFNRAGSGLRIHCVCILFTGLSYVYLDMSDSSKGPKFDRTFRQDRFPRQFSNAQHSAMPGRGNHQPCIPSTSAGDYCRPNGSRSMKLYGDASVFQVRVDGSAFNVCHCFVLFGEWHIIPKGDGNTQRRTVSRCFRFIVLHTALKYPAANIPEASFSLYPGCLRLLIRSISFSNCTCARIFKQSHEKIWQQWMNINSLRSLSISWCCPFWFWFQDPDCLQFLIGLTLNVNVNFLHSRAVAVKGSNYMENPGKPIMVITGNIERSASPWQQ